MPIRMSPRGRKLENVRNANRFSALLIASESDSPDREYSKCLIGDDQSIRPPRSGNLPLFLP